MIEGDEADFAEPRRADWRRGLLFGAPLFALLFALAGKLGPEAIEEDLASRISGTLSGAGFTKIAVDMDGRDASFRGLLDPGREDEVRQLADRYGVRNISMIVAPDLSPDDDVLDPVARFEQGSIVLLGTVFSDRHRDVLVNAAASAVGPNNVYDNLDVVTRRNPPPETDRRIEALASLTLDLAASMEAGQAVFRDGDLSLSGRLSPQRPGVEVAMERARAVTAPFDEVTFSVSLDPPLAKPVPSTTTTTTAVAPTVTSAPPNPVIAQINSLVAVDPIQFEFGSAVLTAETSATLDEIAELLSTQTGVVTVEGHTDNDGDAALNQALSQQRADAVRAALINRGIADARLVAVGYGATRPIAPNTDFDGRAANRRVVFSAMGAT